VRGRASSHWLDRARAKPRSRARRIVCGLLLTYGSLGLLWPFTAMHQRDVLAVGGGTLSDTMHVALGGVTVLLMFLAIAVGATAFGKRFRLYSVSSIVILLAFGALTFWEAPRLQTNLPTPWIGLWERINISVFLLWVVYSLAFLRRRRPGDVPRAVGGLLAGICLWDALVLAAAGRTSVAALALALFGLTLLLQRYVSPT